GARLERRPPPQVARDGHRRPDSERTARRRARGRRADEQGDRAGALRDGEDRGGPPLERLPQARAQLTARARGRARLAVGAGRLAAGRAAGGGGPEPFARVRPAALDGQAVGAGRETRLGTLDRREVVPEVLRAAGVELVLVELGGLVGGLVLVGELAHVRVPE